MLLIIKSSIKRTFDKIFTHVHIDVIFIVKQINKIRAKEIYSSNRCHVKEEG